MIFNLPAHFSFSLDNEWFGTIPTGDGYFKRGQFTGYNPWIDGGLDAPFDQEVIESQIFEEVGK